MAMKKAVACALFAGAAASDQFEAPAVDGLEVPETVTDPKETVDVAVEDATVEDAAVEEGQSQEMLEMDDDTLRSQLTAAGMPTDDKTMAMAREIIAVQGDEEKVKEILAKYGVDPEELAQAAQGAPDAEQAPKKDKDAEKASEPPATPLSPEEEEINKMIHGMIMDYVYEKKPGSTAEDVDRLYEFIGKLAGYPEKEVREVLEEEGFKADIYFAAKKKALALHAAKEGEAATEGQAEDQAAKEAQPDAEPATEGQPDAEPTTETQADDKVASESQGEAQEAKEEL